MRKYTKKSIQYLTKGEKKKLGELDFFFEAVLDQKDKNKAARDFLIFKMMYFHALRCGEVVKIKLGDLDFDRNRIYIAATKEGEAGNEFLNPDEKKLILEYLEIRPKDKTDFLFISEINTKKKKGGPLGRQRINTLFKELAQKAGLPENKQHPHALRHSWAVHCANSGDFNIEEVQKFLRHKSSRTTAIYFKILEEKKIELQERAFERLR